MNHNNLSVASPSVVGANKGGGQHFRKIMQATAAPETVGYTSTFVEMFAWVMTVSAYQCFWELLCPHINPYGWGYDIWYDKYAKKRVVNHKMGIISTMKVYHEQNFSAIDSGRSDTTDMKIKWKAIKSQEKYFKRYLNTQLHHFKLRNQSWNGAATGFLYPPPLS